MQFLHPNVFYMMLIPLILLVVLILTSKDTIGNYFTKEMVDKLTVGDKYLDKNSRNGIFFLVLIMFIIALARPVIDKKNQDIKQELIPIVVALDISRSMRATDIYPNRISLGKKKLNSIIELSKNSTIGILLFAKDSFIVSPLSEDLVSLKYIVKHLNVDQVFENGSNIYATLEATNYMLSDFNVKNLIILSDGGNNNQYRNELQYAKKHNITIYSIGLATKKGAPIPTKDGYLTDSKGQIVTVRLNDSIKELSLKSGGGYIDFTLDDSDIKAILNKINKESKKEQLSTQNIKVYTELFYYPLGFGIFLLLLALSSLPSFKRSQNIALMIFILGVVYTPQNSFGFEFEFETIQKAKESYKNHKYNQSSDLYRKISSSPQQYYNLGNSLYKQKKYKDAIKSYENVITSNDDLESKKLHNIANSYVKLNNLKKAKQFYEKSLKIKFSKDTKENLDIVNKELEKQKKQKQKQNKKQKNKKDNQNKKNKKDKKDNQQKNNGDKNKKDKNNKGKKSQDKKDKNDNQNKKNKKDKKDKKDSQKQQDKENKKDQQKDKSKNEQDKKDNKKQQHNSKQNIKRNNKFISANEEKKWMQMLQNQQTPIFIQKVKTKKESNNDQYQPW